MKHLLFKKRHNKNETNKATNKAIQSGNYDVKQDVLNIDQHSKVVLREVQHNINDVRKRKAYLYAGIRITITVIVTLMICAILGGIAMVDGVSMEPTFEGTSCVMFLHTSTKKCKRGDIVVIQLDGQKYIKRVVGIGGDVINVDDTTGEVLINGEPESETSGAGLTYTRPNGIIFPITVPDDEIFVLGDNRRVSMDSRNFGNIDNDKLSGKVFFHWTVEF